jgi:hypothetical protein
MTNEGLRQPVRSSAAQRMRRYRQRCRSGMRMIPIRLEEAEVDALVARKYLEADQRADKKAIEVALETFVADELGAL